MFLVYIGTAIKQLNKGRQVLLGFRGFYRGRRITGLKVELCGQKLDSGSEYILYLRHVKIVDTLLICRLIKYKKIE